MNIGLNPKNNYEYSTYIILNTYSNKFQALKPKISVVACVIDG